MIIPKGCMIRFWLDDYTLARNSHGYLTYMMNRPYPLFDSREGDHAPHTRVVYGEKYHFYTFIQKSSSIHELHNFNYCASREKFQNEHSGFEHKLLDALDAANITVMSTNTDVIRFRSHDDFLKVKLVF